MTEKNKPRACTARSRLQLRSPHKAIRPPALPMTFINRVFAQQNTTSGRGRRLKMKHQRRLWNAVITIPVLAQTAVDLPWSHVACILEARAFRNTWSCYGSCYTLVDILHNG